jgi:hypothetical protein
MRLGRADSAQAPNRRDILHVDSTIQRFDSLSQADDADTKYYAGLTPEQRLEVLFELIAMQRDSLDENSQRFERVYRVTELERS